MIKDFKLKIIICFDSFITLNPPYTKHTISSLIPSLNWAVFAMLGLLSEGLQIFFQLHKKRNNVWRFVLLWFFSLCNIFVVGFGFVLNYCYLLHDFGFCQPKVSNLFWWFFIFSSYNIFLINKQEKCGDVHKMFGFYAFLVIFFICKRLMGLTFFSFSPTPWCIGGKIWGGNNKFFKTSKACQIIVKKVSHNILLSNEKSMATIL
jgi:hypothetical protein